MRALDTAFAEAGAARGVGEDAESVARVLGPPGDDQWATEYVHRTCKVPADTRWTHVLGVDTGTATASTEQFRAITDKVAEVHRALQLLEDAPTELVLLRRCADVCKVTHLLRAAGPAVTDRERQHFDGLVSNTLQRTLGGGLCTAALDQAAVAVADGGLGMRRAQDLAEPAFVASRVEARPFVMELFAGLATVGASAETSAGAYDADVRAALEKLCGALPGGGRAHVDGLVAAAEDDARQRAAVAYGRVPRRVQRPTDVAENVLITPAGAEDPEARRDGSLQSALCRLVDTAAMDHLTERLEAEEDYDGARRLRELRDPDTDHQWLWSFNPVHGAALRGDEYARAVRIRIGGDFLEEPQPCTRCLGGWVDEQCVHALSCARGESTRGHNHARDSVHQLAFLADPAAVAEPRGLTSRASSRRRAHLSCLW